MTFALGRRFIVVDGVERWKDKQLDAARRRRSRTSRPTPRSRSSRARTAAPRPPSGLHDAVKTGRRRHQRRGERQAVGAAQVGDRPRAGAGAAARAGRRPRAHRARRRPPAAAAARAREARHLSDPASAQPARVDGADGRGADRAVGRAQGVVAGRRDRRAATRPLPPRCTWRCAARESACRDSCTGSASGSGRRTRSACALEAGRAAGADQAEAADALEGGRPADRRCPAQRSRGARSARSRRSPTSSSPPAAAEAVAPARTRRRCLAIRRVAA